MKFYVNIYDNGEMPEDRVTYDIGLWSTIELARQQAVKFLAEIKFHKEDEMVDIYESAIDSDTITFVERITR